MDGLFDKTRPLTFEGAQSPAVLKAAVFLGELLIKRKVRTATGEYEIETCNGETWVHIRDLDAVKSISVNHLTGFLRAASLITDEEILNICNAKGEREPFEIDPLLDDNGDNWSSRALSYKAREHAKLNEERSF